MGLDSVELLMAVEDFFCIEIPNAEAEEITTIQLMVDCVARHLQVKENSFFLQDIILGRLEAGVKRLGLFQNPLQLSDLLVLDDEAWKRLELEIDLKIPRPGTAAQPIQSRFRRWISSSLPAMYDPADVTVEQVVAAIGAENFQPLMNGRPITSFYEIYLAVLQITANKIGVEYYEMDPGKSFTNDLGVD